MSEEEKIRKDALIYGTGVYYVKDTTIERIDPNNFFIKSEETENDT